MSRRMIQGAVATPGLAQLIGLAGLMLGVAIAVVLIYHFVLASRTGGFSPAKAAPAPVVQPAKEGIGGAHAEAIREAMSASAS